MNCLNFLSGYVSADCYNEEDEAKSTLDTSIAHSKRCDTSLIDDEENVTVIRGDSSVKYLSEIAPNEIIADKGTIDIYCSGTGRGKTTEIVENGSAEAREKGCNILLIVHRKAILNQLVEQLSGSKSIPINYDNGVYTFGNTTITTYQKLHCEFTAMKKKQTFYNKPLLFGKSFRMVCGDEIHSIVEDALFCQSSNEILDDIFDFFGISVSYCFLSATMENVERIIYEKACKKLRWFTRNVPPSPLYPITYFIAKPTFRKYVLNNTYEKYFVSYMKSNDEIIDLYESIPDKRKLLVFVSSKKSGIELLEQLDDSVFIFAENETEKLSKEATTEYENIIKNERFDCKCLITTKLLDAGMNLKMKDLCDIVIATEDGEAEFKQIIGRKRNPDNAQVNLFIMSKSKKYFNFRSYECREKLHALSEIKYCNCCKEKRANPSCETCNKDAMEKYFSNIENIKLIDGLVKIKGNHTSINEMSENKLNIMLDYYDELLKDFDNIGDNAFILKQLSWLGLENQYSPDNYYSNDNIPITSDDLSMYLENHINDCMDTEHSKMEFRKRFQELAIKLKYYSKRSENTIGLVKINSILRQHKIPYIVESTLVNSITTWRVIRHVWNDETTAED